MKLFVKKTILFLSCFISLLLLFIGSINYYIDIKSDFTLKKSTKYLILGHSHPECAFNDSLIKNTVNLSQSAEAYFYTYQKVKKVLRQNPQIKVVFVELSNNQINERMNDWIWDENDEGYLSTHCPKYLPFMESEDFLLLMTKNPSGFINVVSLAFKSNLSRIYTKNYFFIDEIGDYFSLSGSKIDSLLQQQNSQEFLDITENNLSYSNIEYLCKIISFCKLHKREVYLIRSPLHENYYGLKNELIFKELIKNEFSSSDFLDFKDFPLNNIQYADFEHLNYKGAKVFSIWFDSLLSDSLLTIENKQEYINNKMPKTTIND